MRSQATFGQLVLSEHIQTFVGAQLHRVAAQLHSDLVVSAEPAVTTRERNTLLHSQFKTCSLNANKINI